MTAQPLARLNPSSGMPVYLQLVEQVRRHLETGALQPGEALPDVLPLAEALVVHPAAVARAYRELESLSLVVRSEGVLRAVSPSAAPQARPVDRGCRTGSASDRTGGWTGLSRELETACEVQRCLLPPAHTDVAGLDYAGVSRAAQGVTGDYYHFVALPGARLAIAIGDVCGKGVPAALGMAALRAYLHGASASHQADPRALVTLVNDLVYESVPAGRFATLFYGVYDLATRTLHYVNAGHLPPVLIRQVRGGRAPERLTMGGVAIGLMPAAQYVTGSVVLAPGDLLVAFTDGISDAVSTSGDEWGDDGALASLEHCAQHSARAIVDIVLAAAEHFARDVAQHDDMTVAAVRVM
jgi:serine phosphatase RsbU (regulator of sigma subunit)